MIGPSLAVLCLVNIDAMVPVATHALKAAQASSAARVSLVAVDRFAGGAAYDESVGRTAIERFSSILL